MATLLYPDFLENPASYDAAEAMWKNFFDMLAIENGFSYTSYINILLPNGEKERDANPIFSAYLAPINRGVRILQASREEAGDLYISGWLDTFELEEDKSPLNELVISLVLSEETKAIAESWIKLWLIDDIDESEIAKYIEKQMVLVN